MFIFKDFRAYYEHDFSLNFKYWLPKKNQDFYLTNYENESFGCSLHLSLKFKIKINLMHHSLE